MQWWESFCCVNIDSELLNYDGENVTIFCAHMVDFHRPGHMYSLKVASSTLVDEGIQSRFDD